jgi:formylglycine-generating enzyme required for sulfatase activity
VVWVSGFDALRFCNWLQNGQGNGDTESGTYTITNGGPDTGTLASNLRADWAPTVGHWALPTENEWYKAAYYKGGGTNSGYWSYPTSSNTPPTFMKPADVNNPVYQAEYGVSPANAANYSGSGGAGYPRANGSLIDVGSYPLSVSPYGTLDQGGNAEEWTETAGRIHTDGWGGGQNAQVIVRGGSYEVGVTSMSSTEGVNEHPPTANTNFFGFRVDYIPSTEVPEPGSLVLLAGMAWMVLLYGRRRN